MVHATSLKCSYIRVARILLFMREVEEKERKSNRTRFLCLLKDVLYVTFSPLLVFQSLQQADSIILTLTFSLNLSHTHTHTHPSCASDSAPVQTACQSVCQIGPRNRSQSLTQTRTQWGSQWEIFGMVSLGMSWHVWGMSPCSCLLSLPPFPFPSCPTGRGRSRVGRQQRGSMPVFELVDLDWVFPSNKMKMKQYLQPILLL